MYSPGSWVLVYYFGADEGMDSASLSLTSRIINCNLSISSILIRCKSEYVNPPKPP